MKKRNTEWIEVPTVDYHMEFLQELAKLFESKAREGLSVTKEEVWELGEELSFHVGQLKDFIGEVGNVRGVAR